MKVIADDLWLCEDCTLAAVNGDFTRLDYYLNPDAARARQQEIEAGLDKLGPYLVPNFADEEGEEEFSRRECDCCGTGLAGRRLRLALLIED